jgi:hypothetical protein
MVTALLLLYIFRPVLQHPNSYIFSREADGLKNYYNFSYYLKYDKGIRFDGVNYPYGDHLQFINSHPLYVQVMKFIDRHIWHISPYGVGILNLTMIFSILLAVPFLFLILRRFRLPRWYAFWTALVILFLSPQLGRMGGHFEMAYLFFFPLYFYLMIRWYEGRRRWLWGTLMVLTALAGGFTSAYYAAFFLIFPLAFILVRLWVNRRDLKGVAGEVLALFTIAVIPVLAVKGFSALTDWVNDRPHNPWGFYVYHANIWSIFLPFKSELKDLLPARITRYQWEGRAFVGQPALWLAVTLTVTFGWYLLRRKRFPVKIFFSDRDLNTWLAAAVIVLLFSMCIPFKWGLHFLTDLIPPLKQFRALGRFSWWFYYVYTLFAAWFFYRLFRWLRLKKAPILAGMLLGATLTYWSLDAAMNVKKSTGRLFNKNDRLESSDEEYLARFREAGQDPQAFQAIFFLPFANTSGDKFYFERGLGAFGEAMKCSYHTHIPIVESFSPRLSFSQALSSIQMLAHPSIYKVRVDDMNDKPLLLLVRKQPLHDREQWLFDHATVWWEDKYIALATVPVQVFNEAHRQWLAGVRPVIDSLAARGRIAADGLPQEVIHKGFEEDEAEHVFTGKGAFYMKKGSAVLLDTTLTAVPEGELELSFWFWFDERIYGMPEAWLEMYDPEGKMNKRMKLDTRSTHDVFHRWVRVTQRFRPEKGYRCRLTVKGKYVTVDDLLVKPVHTHVWMAAEPYGLFDNYPVAYKAGSP